MTTLAELLAAKPRLHLDGKASWQCLPLVLDFIDRTVQPGWQTLETGAGLSTAVFALRGARHTAVMPAADEAVRIRAFCREHGIPTDDVEFVIQRSELALPAMTSGPLDLILIDGHHGFPTPFLDWYYTADRLRVGGLLIVDDTQLWTGHTLKQFLVRQPGWQVATDFAPRSVVFRKVDDVSVHTHHVDQPYVMDATIDFLLADHPDLLEDMRPYLPEDLLRRKERSAHGRAIRLRRGVRTLLGNVLPGPVKARLKRLVNAR
jgi:hypothetical protein